VIALRRGWHIEKLPEPVIYETDKPFHVRIEASYLYVNEHGEHMMSPWQTEELAREHVEFPDYSTDLNIAWELLPINRHVRLVRHTDRGGAAHGLPNEIGAEIWNCDTEPATLEAFGAADTPALAICRAWLTWHEAQAKAD
jgi:hypothetical protein